jgi:hypothetical protein
MDVKERVQYPRTASLKTKGAIPEQPPQALVSNLKITKTGRGFIGSM